MRVCCARPLLLTFPHMWVRKVASRILSTCLKACHDLAQLAETSELLHSATLKELAGSSCNAIGKTSGIDDRYKLSVVENLSLCAQLMYKVGPSQTSVAMRLCISHRLESRSIACDRATFCTQVEQDAKQAAVIEVEEVFSGGLDEGSEQTASNSTLGWLFRRMSALCLRGEELQQYVAIQWLGRG